MMIDESVFEQLEKMNRQRKDIEADTDALADDIDVAEGTNDVEYTQLQKLMREYQQGIDFVNEIINSSQIQGIVKAVDESKKKDATELDRLLYVEGRIQISKGLEVLGFEEDSYHKGALESPYKLKADLRNSVEKDVMSLRSLLINSIPMDSALLKQMDPKKAQEAFKAVYLKAFDDLEQRFKYHNFDEVNKMLSMKQIAIKFLDYPLQMAMKYESGWDLSIPIDKGLVTEENRIIADIKTKTKELTGIDDNLSLRNSELTVVTERLRIKLAEEANADSRMAQKASDEKALDLRIEQKRKEAQSNSDEGEEEESG